MTTYAHKLVAETAHQMAHEVYEECARNNEWRRHNPSRRNFVRRCAPTMLQHARATLAGMLTRDDVSETQKAEIMSALVADQSVPRGAGVSVH